MEVAPVAGRRLTRTARDGAGQAPARVLLARARRIRAAARARYELAQTERQRLAVALDYARAAEAAALEAGVDEASDLLADAVRAAMAAGDAITKRLAEQDRRR